MSPDTEEVFESKLEPGAGRFLAHVIEHAFAIGRRTSDDFVKHFPPKAIMAGLELRPNLRADILEPTTGTRRKIGLRKSSASAGEDLQIAIDEGEATSAQVIELFRPDDRVKYLDNKALWSFLVEGEFWRADGKNPEALERAREHVAFVLERALTDGLLTHADLVDGVSVESLAQSLPRETLAEIITAALSRGRDGKAFTEKDLLQTAAARILVEDVSLALIWETVVVPKIARAHGLSDESAIVVEDAQLPATAAKKGQASTNGGNDKKSTKSPRKKRSSWSVSGSVETAAPEATKNKPATPLASPAKAAVKTTPAQATSKAANADDLGDLTGAIEDLEVEDFEIEEEELEHASN